MTKNPSPWWYRRRSLVIFLMYMIGFYGCGWLWISVTGERYESTFSWIALRGGFGARPLLWAATVLVFAGFAIRLWGSSYLRANVVWNQNALDDRLIVDGPFRYIRNPLYFGNNLQAIGVGLLASPYGFAFIVIANFLFTWMLAGHEAYLMRERYGVVYERFRAAVPAMLPRLTPANVEGSVRGVPSAASGIRSELFTLGLAVGMGGIAIFGAQATPFFGACWIGGWLLQSVLRAIAEPRPA